MILKGFKEKSNIKYLHKLLTNRTCNGKVKPIESLGVIVNIDEFSKPEALKSLSKILKIDANKIQIITFSTTKQEEGESEFVNFSPIDLGWKGTIKNAEIQSFLDSNFDALISYYSTDILELKLLTAAAKSDFKIGLLQEEQRLNDLILNVNPEAIEVFKTELLKYLNILNRI